MKKAIIILITGAVLFQSCTSQHVAYRAKQSKGRSHGNFRHDHNPNFKGCKQNYRTLNFPH
jgi:hypothetical protein